MSSSLGFQSSDKRVPRLCLELLTRARKLFSAVSTADTITRCSAPVASNDSTNDAMGVDALIAEAIAPKYSAATPILWDGVAASNAKRPRVEIATHKSVRKIAVAR